MTRYRDISSAEMTSAQREVHDEIVAGRRGRFGGPFQILIRAPEVCRHLQRLGEYLRWGSSLPPALSELAICLTARHLRASYEWHAHAPLAVEAGVPAAGPYQSGKRKDVVVIRERGARHCLACSPQKSLRLISSAPDRQGHYGLC